MDNWRNKKRKHIQLVRGPKRKFKVRNNEFESDVCWLTNNKFVAASIRNGTYPKVSNDIKRGMIQQCIDDMMLRNEDDRYICYAVDDDDWRQE